MNERELRVPRRVYRLRVLGLFLGCFCIAVVFYERGATPWAWGLLAFHGLVWPHVAWALARTSADPHRAERANLVVDSAIGGVFVPLMQFPLLPSVLIIAMLSMDKIGWGWRFLGRTCGAMAFTLIVTTLLTHASVQLETTMPMIAASLPLMVAYPFAVAFVSERSGRLARERRDAIEQTVLLREQLAHAARVGTLGEMAAGLAHELNQPLTAIHLEASTALELHPGGLAEDVRDGLTRIADQSLRAGDIVRRMRTFARRGRAQRDPILVGQLIREVLALLDHNLRHNDIAATIAVPETLPPVLVDRLELEQVFVNLIRNAVEAMSAPSITSRQLTITAERDGDLVRVSVSDTGGGVAPEVLPHLFHPFQTTKVSGLGLGLSICHSLAEANGGRVGAGPHPPGGARFFVELPAAPAAVAV